jgi:hypothetical protein
VTSIARTSHALWPVHEQDPFLSGERLPAGLDPQAISRFGDSTWDLSPLGAPSRATESLNLERFWEPLRDSFRRAAWALVNLPIPEDLLARAGSNRVRWPSTGTMMLTFQAWRSFDTWLRARNITGLCDLTETDLEDYAVSIAKARRAPVKALYSISLLWGFAPHLPDCDRIPMPPWETRGMRDYLPPTTAGNENDTPPIHPAVMSPLLTWAMRFVDDFAEDILAAWRERQALFASIPQRAEPPGRRRVQELLHRYRAEDRPLPGHVANGGSCPAITYLCAASRATAGQVKDALDQFGSDLQISTQTPLELQPAGLLHGRAWKTHINFHEAPLLMVRLSAACAIVIFYLSGMRAGEGLCLQVGCSPVPDSDNNHEPVQLQVHGRYFKSARDQDGKHVAGGLPRTIPWTVIAPVVRAIRVLERMTDGPHLFPSDPAWSKGTNGRRRAAAGKTLTSEAANDRTALFIAWVNDFVQDNNIAGERIPDDPDGPIVLSRLRRTIAWHIARLPGGRIALSVQYGHLRTVVGEGYSGRARAGLRRILDVETARAMSDYLDQVAERIHDGEAVSGPAARRMIKAAQDARTRFEGMFLTPRQADALLSEPHLHVYDNPGAFLTCNHDPLKALCHPERAAPGSERHPALDRCDPACANIARTDTHIEQLEHERAQLGEQISSPLTPMPLRERLKQRTAALEAIMQRHYTSRITDAHGDERAADD